MESDRFDQISSATKPLLPCTSFLPDHVSHQTNDQLLSSETNYCRNDNAHESGTKVDISRCSSTSSINDLKVDRTTVLKISIENAAVIKPERKQPGAHPQKSMDEFWSNFDPEFLGKVTRILPSSLLTSSSAVVTATASKTQYAAQSYDQAKSRCLRDCTRIVRECRSQNKKYTDTHFDIERDLKITKRRDCLDGLYNTCTNGVGQALDAKPADVKRVCDIFESPTFFDAGATYDDIMQGDLGDCWLLAALSILTCNERLVNDICVFQDMQVGVYGFVFYRDGDWLQCIIDDKLYLRAPAWEESGDQILGMYGVKQDDQEESYTKLFQKGKKALAKAHGCYGSLDGGQTGEAIEDLTGGVTTETYTTNILDKDQFWNDELRRIGKDFVFSAAASSYREWRAPHNTSVRLERRAGIVSHHAYAVIDTYEGFGQRLVKLRNPWGVKNGLYSGKWSIGSKEMDHVWLKRLDYNLADDAGVFWMSYDDMLDKYKYLDRTRIFNHDWHVVQQWTSVQVPWNTTDYQQTRFLLEVPHDTDTVIILSQLNHRYFQGLQGKYNYRLQFRIQGDVDDEEEYLTRTPQNYELVRSNNVEVSLTKGKYTVLFKVEAQKTNRKDVEAVVRDNIWRKEKLMQMGTLYDIAHTKGARSAVELRPLESLRPKLNLTTSTTSVPQVDDKGNVVIQDEKKREEKDPNRDPWNAFCVVGLRVYSKHSNMGLKISYPDENEPASPVLDRDDIAKAALDEATQNIDAIGL